MASQESNTSKAIKGMSSQTLVTIVLGVVEIVAFSIMSRLLTQEDFGYYAAITAVTVVFASFSETGIGAAIIQRKEINQRYIDNAFTLSFIFGAIISLLLFALAIPLSDMVADRSMSVPLMLMSVTLLCNCLTSVNTSIMYRRMEFLRVGVINLIALVITTIVAVVLAIKGFGYYAILTKAILTSVVTLVISWIMAKTKYRFAFDKETFKSIFNFSGWLMASVFFRNLAQQLDRLLMSRLLSVQSLGAYNRPKDFISQITNKLGGIFDTALFPVLSQIQDNYVSMKNAYLRSVYLMNLATVVLALGFVFNGELIIRIFFGADWFSVLTVFQVLSVAIIFQFDGRLADCYLRSLGWTKQQFFFRVGEVTAKIVGLFVGYHWGIIGVAISVLLTDALMVGVKHFYIAKRINITLGDGISVLFKSMQVSLILMPLFIIAYLFLPHTIGGEISFLCIFIILLAVCFLLLPSTVGHVYKESIHPKLKNTLLTKLKIKQ